MSYALQYAAIQARRRMLGFGDDFSDSLDLSSPDLTLGATPLTSSDDGDGAAAVVGGTSATPAVQGSSGGVNWNALASDIGSGLNAIKSIASGGGAPVNAGAALAPSKSAPAKSSGVPGWLLAAGAAAAAYYAFKK